MFYATCSVGVSEMHSSLVSCEVCPLSDLLIASYICIIVQFFPTAEESIDYYNQKRCIDGKGLVLPSQIVSLFLYDFLQK